MLVFDAENVCFSERFWPIGRRKQSIQLSLKGQYIQFNQNVQINVKRSSIALSFIERFGGSDTPVYNVSEQSGHLSIILNGFKISNPP